MIGNQVLAVVHKHMFGFGIKVADPGQQAVPVRMGGQAVIIDDPRPHGNLLAKQPYFIGTLDQCAPQRAGGLEPHKQDGAFPAPQVVLEVVADAPGITHAGSGDDDLGGGVQVDGNRILFGFTDLQTGERQRVFALRHQG